MKDNTNMNDVLLKTPIFTVVRGREVQPNFRPILVKSPDWVSIVVEKDGMFLMEKQHRYGLDKVCEEFPCGMIEENEAPIKAAIRELVEETGYSVDESQLVYLGKNAANPAFMTNYMHYFYVKLTDSNYKITDTNLDEHEQIISFWKNKAEAEQDFIKSNTSAIMAGAWYRLRIANLI